MQTSENENVANLRLEHYFLVLYRSKWSIFFILVLAIATAFLKNDTSQPVYQATVKLWVKQPDTGMKSSGLEDIFMSGLMGRTTELETLCEIIRSPAALDGIIDDLALLDNPTPKHRGRFVTWISDRLKISLLNAIPEMSMANYTAFRQAWVSLEAPYLADHLESLAFSQALPSSEAGKEIRRLRIEELDAALERLGKLSWVSQELRPAAEALKESLEPVREEASLTWAPPAEVLSALRSVEKRTNELAEYAFSWRMMPLFDTQPSLAKRARHRAEAKLRGTRAIYDVLWGDLEPEQQPPYLAFQNYMMDPAFDYGEYQRLIQRQLQEHEISEAYDEFRKQNANHPDRGLWRKDVEFRAYYRRLQREELLQELQKNLSVQPARDADVIQITVKAPSQERAVGIANRLATWFEESMTEDARERMQETQSFAQERKVQIEKSLLKAEADLSQYQQQETTISLSAEAEATIRSLNQLELLHAQAKVRHDGATQRIEQLMVELKQEDPTIVSSETLSTNPLLANIRLKVKEAQVELKRLKRKYPDGQSEEIARQAAMIAAWEEALASETEHEITSTSSPNPLVASLTDQLIRAQSEQLAAAAEMQTLKTEIGVYKTRLQAMPSRERRLAELRRNVQLYQSLYETLAQAEQEAAMLEKAEPGNIETFQAAMLREEPVPVSPRRPMNLMMGGLIGLFLGLGLAFLREYLDNTYGTVEEAQRDLELVAQRIAPALRPTFLTMVPAIESIGGDRSYVVALREPRSGPAEAFRVVRTKLQFMGSTAPIRCILVTSSKPGEGKSTIASNLTATLAQQMGKRVLLVDADLRKPVQYRIFARDIRRALPSSREEGEALVPNESDATVGGTGGQHQLATLLVHWRNMLSQEGDSSLLHRWFEERRGLPDGSNGSHVLDSETEESVRERLRTLVQPYIYPVRVEIDGALRKAANGSDERVRDKQVVEFDLIPNRLHPPNPSELLSSESMEQLLEFLRTEYDYIVIDSPPVQAAADPIILSSYVDAVIYTFDIVKTKRFDIRTAMEELLEANPRNIGTLCNMTDIHHGGYYGYGGRYGYNKYGYYYGRYRSSGYYEYYYGEDAESDTES